MIYTFDQIKKVKQDMEWIIKECSSNPKLLAMRKNEAIKGLKDNLFAYENLLREMGVHGRVDTVKDNLPGIDITVDFIKKIKINIAALT